MAPESWKAPYSRPLPTRVCTPAAVALGNGAYRVPFLGGVSQRSWSIHVPEAFSICWGLCLFLGVHFCGPCINGIPWTHSHFANAPLPVYISLAPLAEQTRIQDATWMEAVNS